MMDKQKLAEILKKHLAWLNDEDGGERADLRGADLRSADLRNADLGSANLYGANLYCADLRNANLRGTKLEEKIKARFFPLVCPEKGSFTAWKTNGAFIIKLRVLEDSKRSSAYGRKCRCSKAEVLEIQNMDGTKAYRTSVCSNYDHNFIYTVGKIVEVDDFDEDRWQECSSGIHFFITRQEAVDYFI